MSDVAAPAVSKPQDDQTNITGLGPNPATEAYNPQIQIDESKIEALSIWLDEELEKAKRDRTSLDEKLIEWERLYEARPKVAIKTEPWYNASNLVVPVIATAVDGVLARLLGAVFGGKQLWVGSPRASKWVDVANPIENWLNWLDKEVLKMYRVSQSWFLGALKFGTGVLKLPWERRVRHVEYLDRTGALLSEDIVIKDGAAPKSISLIDFFFSSDAITTNDFQYCQWISARERYTWKEMKELEYSGIFYDVDKIKDSPRQQVNEYETEVGESTGIEVSEPQDYEIFEFWCSYDINENGIPVELVINFEPETRTIVRAVYNYYRHQERPFHFIRFTPRENSPLGVGLCQMLEDIQVEVTTIHNQRLDNATLANTKMFKRKRGSIIDEEEVGPGGFLYVDNMDDIEAFDLGTDHSSLLVEEQHTIAIGEKRSGYSDYSAGRESSAIGSRATATSTVALIREGNKRFKMLIQDIREALGSIAHQVIMLYQQFAPMTANGESGHVFYELFSDKDKVIIQEFFELPNEYSRNGIIIDTPALSESENKEIMQQTMLTLMGVVQNYYGGLFEAFQVALNPEAPEPAKQLAAQAAIAGSKIWERVLEAFDFKDPESFVPDIEAMLGLSGYMEQNQGGINGNSVGAGVPGQRQTPGNNGGAPGVGSQSLMANSQTGAGAATGLRGTPA